MLKGDSMAKMVDRKCKCGCGEVFKARVADVKRGWGKFYSKSCKARHQEKRTGQYKSYLNRESYSNDDAYGSWPEGWDEHKDWTGGQG